MLIQFAKEAYEAEEFAFISDQVSVYVVYHYGTKGSNHHYIACYAMAVDRHSTNNLMENSRVVQPEWNGFICDMLFYKVLDYSAKTQGS